MVGSLESLCLGIIDVEAKQSMYYSVPVKASRLSTRSSKHH